MYFKELMFVLFMIIPTTKGAIPGTYFWRPRFGLELAVPTPEPALLAYPPNKKNVQDGLVVLIDGYDVLTSLIGLAQSIQFANDDESMNPRASVYYTDMYRWMLRTIDLLPYWIRGNFEDALGVWNNRFKFMDASLPDSAKKWMPWVKKSSWDKEYVDQKRFVKDTELEFAAFYRYPSKIYNNFESFLPDTADQHIFSSVDRDDFSFRQASNRLKSIEAKKHKILHEARPRD